MKEITRIHIAKVPYDIEIAAKKELETYIKTLEAYSNDTEIIEDVEIRITEILSERGVAKSGVITEKDVAALKQQLGDPEEFMDNGDIAVGPDATATGARRLYRDTDNAVLGGVMSGIGAFFKINPLWVRITFIILAFASFGMAAFIYLILWIAIPPVRTATDRLQMAGRPVTVGSIREVIASDTRSALAQPNGNTRRIVTIFFAILCVIGATVAAMSTTFAVAIVISRRHEFMGDGSGSGYLWAAFVCAVISGVLLMTLFILAAYAAFTQKMPRRILVSICTVIVLGLVSFGTTIGFAQYGIIVQRQELQTNIRQIDVPLPEGSDHISSLIVNQISGISVVYIATSEKPHATLRAVVRSDAAMPKVYLSVDKATLILEKVLLDDQLCSDSMWCGSAKQELTVYGPALDELTATRGATIDYRMTKQAKLAIKAEKQARISLSTGELEALTFQGDDNARLDASGASVQQATVDVRTSTVAKLGTVRMLSVNDLGSCPARTREAYVNVLDVTSGSILVNNKLLDVKSIDNGCTEISIEKEKKS